MELLPCPFCGGKATFDHDDNGWYWIVCEKCGTATNSRTHTMEDCHPLLAEQWNRRASPASAPVAAPDYRIADRGFRWDAENRQHIPQLLIEFTPVPENAPNASSGWKDRDKLAAMLVAAPTPPVSEDRKDAERYRWLRDIGNNTLEPMIKRGITATQCDSVIDAEIAAMQEDKQ